LPVVIASWRARRISEARRQAASSRRHFSFKPLTVGIAIASKIASIARTISSSIKEKPFEFNPDPLLAPPF
jgi:hypothetical protein